jgi:hypothetical protein
MTAVVDATVLEERQQDDAPGDGPVIIEGVQRPDQDVAREEVPAAIEGGQQPDQDVVREEDPAAIEGVQQPDQDVREEGPADPEGRQLGTLIIQQVLWMDYSLHKKNLMLSRDAKGPENENRMQLPGRETFVKNHVKKGLRIQTQEGMRKQLKSHSHATASLKSSETRYAQNTGS